MVLNPKVLKKEYRTPQNQLWEATGGFGTKSYTSGSAVFSKSVFDGETCRWERCDFLGVLKE